MTKAVKLANNIKKKFHSYFQTLKSSLFFACLLSLTITKGTYSVEPPFIWSPSDILTHFSLGVNGYLTPTEGLAFIYDKQPNFQISIGNYHSSILEYLLIESKSAFQGSDLRLYSFGVGARMAQNAHKWLPSNMIGGYIFLDTTLQSFSSFQHSNNLVNFNIGLEGRISSQYQYSLNTYFPVCRYDDKSQFSTQKIKSEKSYEITQPYYLESGNYGFDINLSKIFFSNKIKAITHLGGYGYYDPGKLLKIANIIPFQQKSRFILGAAHKLTLEWDNRLSFHYKIAYDTARRPWSISFGITWKHSTHNAIDRNHHLLWLPSAERHLSPLLVPEQVSIRQEASAISREWLKACEAVYQGEKYEEHKNYKKDAYQTIEEVNDFLHTGSESYLFELMLDSPQLGEKTMNKISLFIHPDKLNSLTAEEKQNANTRYIIMRDNIFPELYERTFLSALDRYHHPSLIEKKAILQ